ncbi:MAG: hypothetical protein IJI68_01205 [Eggerthellaceae bacterium]|nr:hypothetical protein [Eggerthellaceae bacterium]
MTNDNADAIDEAKDCARRAIQEAWPSAEEAFELARVQYHRREAAHRRGHGRCFEATGCHYTMMSSPPCVS